MATTALSHKVMRINIPNMQMPPCNYHHVVALKAREYSTTIPIFCMESMIDQQTKVHWNMEDIAVHENDASSQYSIVTSLSAFEFKWSCHGCLWPRKSLHRPVQVNYMTPCVVSSLKSCRGECFPNSQDLMIFKTMISKAIVSTSTCRCPACKYVWPEITSARHCHHFNHSTSVLSQFTTSLLSSHPSHMSGILRGIYIICNRVTSKPINIETK